MKRTVALLACGATLLAGGIFAGSVIGGDGSVDTADRISGDYGDPVVQELVVTGTEQATTAGSGKPKVVYGSGQLMSIDAGLSATTALKCPKEFPVPLSAGLDTSIPGIFPGIITRSDTVKRAMFVAVVNTTGSTGDWAATAVCAKGMKEA